MGIGLKLDQLREQCKVWFDLSLPGRILVSKTFMYSQLNYLGCFLPMDQNRLTIIENKIEEYVRVYRWFRFAQLAKGKKSRP
jgi:hypothetical protein